MALGEANYLSWTPQDVAHYFSQKGFEEYAELWVRHRLTGERLVLMQQGDLQAMGIAAIGDRIGIQKELRALKAQARTVERNKVLSEYTQAYNGSDMSKFIYENCGLALCSSREPDKYTLTSSTLKISSLKCGGCLGGVWKHDTIQLDRITDVDTEITVVGMGMFAARKCSIYLSCSAGVDAETQMARVETHTLFLEQEDGEKLAEDIRHRVVEYRMELSGHQDVL